MIRKVVLQTLDVAHDHHCVIDSLPIPVMKFHLVPSSSGDRKESGAKFGKVPYKSETISDTNYTCLSL